MIPFCDLKAQYDTIKDEIDAAIIDTISNSSFILGKPVKALEENIAAYCGSKYAVGVSSGTDALVLALIACGIKPGDEVITTPVTFVATIEAIVRVGAVPVFVDIEETTYNIDPGKIEEKISEKTKAILPVHLYGHPASIERICEIARQKSLKLIEDCAQSIGSEYRGKKVGTFGDAGCFSFFPAKTLGGYGDGGMIVTDSEEVGETARVLRVHGCKTKNYQVMHGFNARLDALQASIIDVKLKYLDKWIKSRIDNAAYYSKKLEPLENVSTPKIDELAKHSFNYYTIRFNGYDAEKRDAVVKKLGEEGIGCGVYYPVSQHLQGVYSEYGYKKGDLPVSEMVQDQILTLPIFPELTHAQIDTVVDAVARFTG